MVSRTVAGGFHYTLKASGEEDGAALRNFTSNIVSRAACGFGAMVFPETNN
jgi:hypothetical protein